MGRKRVKVYPGEGSSYRVSEEEQVVGFWCGPGGEVYVWLRVGMMPNGQAN